jgi:SAM-dependent methyltransferase
MSLPLSHDTPLLRGPVPLSHLLLRQFVHPGDTVIDATCGNGNDTLLLAGLVGAAGRVWAFDIQAEAISHTSRTLTAAGLSERVTLVGAGHETMAEHINGGAQAVIFNLGYLPGSDRSIFTRPKTTRAGLEQSLNLLTPNGIVAVTVYPGHDGGADERCTVDDLASRLDPGEFHAWRMGQLNVPDDAPFFILIQKVS